MIVLEPDSGLLACGDEGAGRMPDVPVIVQRARDYFGARDLEGRSILITAGPTREPIDPVRYISNRSSGKMGYALADAARRRGARVTLVSGPTALPAPAGVELIDVLTAQEMHDAVLERLGTYDIVIMAAAVADYTPAKVAGTKIKKESAGESLTLELRKNPDILLAVGAASPRPFTVAFAAETDNVEAHAREKLQRKNADLIVANDVSDRTIGFDSDENEGLIIARDGSVTPLARGPKLVIANRILDRLLESLLATPPVP